MLDRRPAPLVCHVQLKTVWVGNDSVSLNLGTLYNIVSDSRPAYIVVLEVDDPSLAFVGMRIIHITGGFLAEILKRLRKAHSEGKSAGEIMFQASISKWSVPATDFSGAAFRRAVEAGIPDGMVAYGTAKQTLLGTLGYEKGQMSLQTVFETTSHEDIVDGFLGLRPLKLIEAEKFDTRFDIPVSLGKLSAENALLEIKPSRFDRGVVKVKRSTSDETLTFPGDIFTAPSEIVGPDRLVLEFRTSLFRIRIDLRATGRTSIATINLTTAQDIGSVAETAAAWRDFYTLFAWASAAEVGFELRARRKKIEPIVATSNPRNDPDHARKMARYARGADLVDWVMCRAEAPDTRISGEDLFKAADDLGIIKAIEQTPEALTPLSFTTILGDAPPPDDEYEMLYITHVKIGAHQIAYAAKAKFKPVRKGDVMHWRSGPLQLTYVRKLKAGQQAFVGFIKKARRVTGIVRWVALTEFDLSAQLPSAPFIVADNGERRMTFGLPAIEAALGSASV
ncbi:hypothetical protein [Novosphingobium sp. KA1]|uniref:hypothetical protein n=1 Tax=Novosphingobium sp. (strain KA1) TaxID=164608 RepID=UPI001A8EF0F0|nr:hypothetical protein [Novosphingobium sp. KA1]QSR19337.1 hypothetical protein CA833_19360 [Novosphingobium sp. KA1]